MRRSVVRSVSVLFVILALSLMAMVAPVSAGALGGGPALVVSYLRLNPDVPCAYFVDPLSGHSFLGIQANAGRTIKLVGPFQDGFPTVDAALPDAMGSGCVNVAP